MVNAPGLNKRDVMIKWLTFHRLPITEYVASWGYSINISPLPYHLPLLSLLFPSASQFHLKKHSFGIKAPKPLTKYTFLNSFNLSVFGLSSNIKGEISRENSLLTNG